MINTFPKTARFILIPLLFVFLFVPHITLAAYGEDTIWSIMTTIGGAVTWVGALALDFAIIELVLKMGDFLSTNVGIAVNDMWGVVRDVCNIVFIFSLIFIGLRTILKSDDSSTKKALGSLIIAALLINFSLLITKTIVDFANIAAFQIHGLIQIEGEYEIMGQKGGAKSIAGAYAQQMHISSYAGKEFLSDRAGKGAGGLAATIGFGFITMIMMIIAGFVFLAGALILVKRFVLLIFFMIFSPLMFAGLIFYKFEGLQSYWWKNFISNAFVAPAYLFMLYLSLFVIQGLSIEGKSFAKAYSSAASENGEFSVFIHFFLVIGFLIGSLIVAQKMGNGTASAALGTLKTAGKALQGGAQRFAGGATFGMAGRLGRITAGRTAQKYSEDNNLRKLAAGKGISGFIARRKLGAARAIADSSFDARGVSGAGKSLGIGEGKKGGYTTRLTESAKAEVAYAKSLGHDTEGETSIENKYNNNVTGKITTAKNVLMKKEAEVVNNEQIKNLKQTMRSLSKQYNAATDDAQREKLALQMEGAQKSINVLIEDIGVDAAKTEMARLTAEYKSELAGNKNALQREYAESHGAAWITFGVGGPQLSHQNQSDRAAIEKEFKKDKNDEILDKLKKLEENSEKAA